jgi:hypothetical protein
MADLKDALALASQGFFIFPLVQNSKLPAIDRWNEKATRDPERISRWWLDPVMGWDQGYNIGVSTSNYGDDQALVVVDIDNKGAKHGDDTVLELDIEGFDLPPTLTVNTPSGGRHLYYTVRQAVKQGTDTLGSGIDTRSAGGYVVGPTSSVPLGQYHIADSRRAVMAPTWVVERCGASNSIPPRIISPIPTGGSIDPSRAYRRGLEFITTNAPEGTEGSRNDTAYRVAGTLKDFGCDPDQVKELLAFEWNCYPPLDEPELDAVVAAAFRYGREAPGSRAPEAQFDAVEAPDDGKLSPMDAMNKEYSYIKAGGFILQETVDAEGHPRIDHLSLSEFKGWFANKKMMQGKTERSMADIWMEWTGRREYAGVTFLPGVTPKGNFYNLWHGFRIEAAKTPTHPSVEAFKEHALQNVCNGDAKLCQWLMGFFAHMIQKPNEKPLVALVFKGQKGVGKNALVERVGWLLNSHFLVADDERYITGNFNSHLESCLFMALDEAAWAGNKRAEGKLKGLVTGTDHLIERKGKEPYSVANKTRIAVLGNEDWLVPATVDERRFAVFNVGEGRMQDRKFFHDMRVGMENGGYAHLLKYLQDFDLSQVDVNLAPATEALAEQKIASLEPFQQWWFSCLNEETMANGDFEGWPEQIETKRLRNSYIRYVRERNIRTRIIDERSVGHFLKRISATLERKRIRISGALAYAYIIPGIEEARKDFENFLGHPIKWS